MKHFFLALGILGGMALAFGPSTSRAADKASPAPGEKQLKVVVHVNFEDAKRQGHGLKNVENMLKAAGGKATVEVVCHGAGLPLLVTGQSKHADKVQSLIKQGVRFAACENTLREKSLGKSDLLAGVGTVPSGAVEVVRKQQEGFGYFKP